MVKQFIVSALLILSLSVQAGTDSAEISGSNLEIVEQGRGGEILADSSVDWNRYSKVQLERATVEFRKNWVRDQRQRYGNVIQEKDEQRIKSGLADLLDEVLSQELTEEGVYSMSGESGPDVMRFTPRIVKLDIVAPDRVRNHIGYSLTDSQGSMTLELEIHDSVSGALLATTRHHQVDPYKGYMEWTTSGTNRRSARLMLLRWASGLCERLNEARATSN